MTGRAKVFAALGAGGLLLYLSRRALATPRLCGASSDCPHGYICWPPSERDLGRGRCVERGGGTVEYAGDGGILDAESFADWLRKPFGGLLPADPVGRAADALGTWWEDFQARTGTGPITRPSQVDDRTSFVAYDERDRDKEAP